MRSSKHLWGLTFNGFYPSTPNRSSYKSKFFLLPVIAFSFLYTLPKFFELRLCRVPIILDATNETEILSDEEEEAEETTCLSGGDTEGMDFE